MVFFIDKPNRKLIRVANFFYTKLKVYVTHFCETKQQWKILTHSIQESEKLGRKPGGLK